MPYANHMYYNLAGICIEIPVIFCIYTMYFYCRFTACYCRYFTVINVKSIYHQKHVRIGCPTQGKCTNNMESTCPIRTQCEPNVNMPNTNYIFLVFWGLHWALLARVGCCTYRLMLGLASGLQGLLDTNILVRQNTCEVVRILVEYRLKGRAKSVGNNCNDLFYSVTQTNL